MEALQKFLQEQDASETCAPEGPSNSDSAAAAPGEAAPASPQFLLITGAADTDSVTNKKDRDTSKDLPVPHVLWLPERVRVAAVFSGAVAGHTVALDEGGRAFAWGLNTCGQLGVNAAEELIYAPTPVSGVDGAVHKVACGRLHTLLCTKDGSLFAAGRNEEGQLGIGRLSVKPSREFTAVKLPKDSRVEDVACGYNVSLCVDQRGTLRACGYPEHGVLGNGSDGRRLERAGKIDYDCETSFEVVHIFLNVEEQPGGRRFEHPITPAPRIKSVACGREHCMALEDPESAPEGKPRVFSWGFGGYGRLGHRGQATELRPRLVAEFATGRHLPVASISCGATCSFAIDTRGSLYYWGKVMNAARGEATMYPQMVQDLCNWETTSCAGGQEAIFAAAEGKIVCWGSSVASELGLGEHGPRGQRNPNLNSQFDKWHVSTVCAGYGHAAFMATPAEGTDPEETPVFEPPPSKAVVRAKSGKRGPAKGKGKGKGGKRQKKG